MKKYLLKQTYYNGYGSVTPKDAAYRYYGIDGVWGKLLTGWNEEPSVDLIRRYGFDSIKAAKFGGRLCTTPSVNATICTGGGTFRCEIAEFDV